MTDKRIEALGEAVGLVADQVDSLVHAMHLPIPDAMHVNALRESLPEVRAELRRITVELLGRNPWE